MRVSLLAVSLMLAPLPALSQPGDELVRRATSWLAATSPEPRAKAVGLLQRASTLGNADAQFLLGMLKVRGTIVPADLDGGVVLLTLAAAQGHGEAENALGLALLHGHGISRDPARGAEMLRRAADKGVVEAQHTLGWLAQTGEAHPKDLAEAARWYRLAAERGYSRSQYNLGLLLAVGAGGPPDLRQAVKWLSLAATSPRADVRGEAEAQIRHLSQGAPADAVSAGLEEARRWLAANRVF